MHPRPTSSSALRVLIVTLALVTGASTFAHGQTWNEAGDAGASIGNAQAPVGAGSLTQINGSLQFDADVDLYCIRMPNVPPANLPLVQLQCVVNLGPNVYLFDAAGNGVFTTTLCQFGTKMILAPTTSLAAGTYYVAVSYSGLDPQAAGGAIWQSIPTSPQRAPDGPGAAGTLTGWAGTPTVQPLNPYTINLTFMEYCDAATPATTRTWGELKVRYRD